MQNPPTKDQGNHAIKEEPLVLERETAIREVLGAISNCRDDDAPVFDAILKNAAQLCDSPTATLLLLNEVGDRLVLRAKWGEPLRHFKIEEDGFALDGYTKPAEAVREGRIVHVENMADTDGYRANDPISRRTVDDEGIRSFLTVPLFKDGKAIGCIDLFRREVRPFTDQHIELIESFAVQAVIAINNVQQFREVQEQLEREKATRNILEVISSSRENEDPVFDSILENASLLCEADSAALMLTNEERSHNHLRRRYGRQLIADSPTQKWPLDSGQAHTESVRQSEIIHEPDLRATDLYASGDQTRVYLVDKVGLRSVLSVPLLRNGEAIGAIVLHRLEVARAFTDNDIRLVESFAAQAVIAIENVRQFRELQERLEREAATSDILEVISRSRDDNGPVFDVILDRAARLSNSPGARLHLLNQDRSQFIVTRMWGDVEKGIELGEAFDMLPDRIPARAMIEKNTVQEHDLRESVPYKNGDPGARRVVDQGGVRTMVAVPLLRQGEAIGCINLTRKEVAPFNDKDIKLVETFAAQAVIAIENVSQFREVQEKLEREQATSEILNVISQSREDEAGVFEIIIEKAAILCDADQSALILTNEERTSFHLAANWGHAQTAFQIGMVWPFNSMLTAGVAIRAAEVLHVPDYAETERYKNGDPEAIHMVETEGIRTRLVVPLMQREIAVGAIALSRREVRSFNASEIQLIETFAAQAVIAINNVRQFRELQKRLEREAATKEVLQIISESREDEQPVFEAILERACRLCEAPSAGLLLGTPEDDFVTFAATNAGANKKVHDALRASNVPMDANASYSARAILEGKLYHLEDMAEGDLYKSGADFVRNNVDKLGIRSVIFAPLMGQHGALGVMALFRDEVRPFDPNQVELVESFAAQAAIAIENVRQFKALESLNAELGDRVKEQVGEIERMGKLKRFLPAAVADTVISQGSEKLLASHRTLLGVLFCDIRGFTAFCETAEPEETIEVLQTYHEEMGKLISEHGAGVDHRMGDGIMVLFNDPIPCDDPAGDAVRLAIAMRMRMAELSKKWKRLGHRLGFGVGVSLGYATVGMVGYEGRSDYTASGTAVNLAARLCDHAEDGEILLSPRAFTAVEDDFSGEATGEVDFKGIREPVAVYRLTEKAADN